MQKQNILFFKYYSKNRNMKFLLSLPKYYKKPDTESVTATASRSQQFVMTNYHPKVVYPGRISSTRFVFER